VPLRQRVLEELALLLVGSSHNRSVIIALVDWQAWFLAIYTDPTEKYDPPSFSFTSMGAFFKI
jgi:hypothetical protein